MNKAPEFKEFWKVYPIKRGKEDAERAWKRMTADEKRKAIAAIPAYIADYERQVILSFKDPQGWLNGKRWKDYEDAATQPATFERPRPSGSTLRQGTGGTKREQPAEGQLFAQPFPSHPRVGSQPESPDDPAAPLEGMETW